MTIIDPAESASKVIESVRDAAEPALESVRRFLDTVEGLFPDVTQDGPRRKIIDSAFKMAEELVGVSTKFAERVVSATRGAPEGKA